MKRIFCILALVASVNLVSSGDGFTIYGDGSNGSVMRSAGGFTISYKGGTSRVAQSASGWTIYKD